MSGLSLGINTSAASRLTVSPVPTATPTSAKANAAASLNPSPTIIVMWVFERFFTQSTFCSGENPPCAADSGNPTLFAKADTAD